jgi:hypothetical protein
MNRLAIITLLVSILISTTGRQLETSSDVTRGTDNSKREYFRAMHGFGVGQIEMVDLSKLEGFDSLRTIDDVAKFAAKVPGAIGFTTHPFFEEAVRKAVEEQGITIDPGPYRYTRAVIWYTGLSSTRSSWPLYLFDEAEAKKKPGEKPRLEALLAAEARVSAKMETAKELIETSGSNGVKLTGDYEERKALSLAIMRLGGSFEHVGEFGTKNCGGCRILVPGGTPFLCGLGVQKKKHWNCCGSTEKKSHCQFWQLIKKQNTSH